MMQRPWELAAADEWLPRQLRLCFGGPSGDSDSSDGGGFTGGDFTGGDTLGGSNFGTDTSSSNFGENTGGSNFSSDGGGFQSSDGGGFQSTSSGFSDSGGYTGGDYSGSYQGSDTGGGYYGFSGSDGGGGYFGGDSTGGGYLGGSSLGGNVAADAYGGGGTAGASPFGGGGGFQGPGGFQDSTTGQGFGNFNNSNQTIGDLPAGTLDALTNTNAMPTINIAAPYEGALSGPDVMAGGRGPGLGEQLGINDIGGGGRNATVDAQLNAAINQSQDQGQAQQQANQTGDQLASDIAAVLGRDTTGVNNFQNITAPTDLTSPLAPAYAPYSPSESLTGQATAPFAGRAGPGMDMEFNPFGGSFQAPSQPNQGTQGIPGRSDAPSLMDMLNPVSTANAQNLTPTDLLSSTQFNQSLNNLATQYGRDTADLPALLQAELASRQAGQMSNYMSPAALDAQARGEQGRADIFGTQQSNQAAKGDYQGPFQGGNQMAQQSLNDLAAQYGRDPATITSLLNNAPYEGPLGGPDVVGDRSQSSPQAQQQQDQGARPGWDAAQQTLGVRGGSELFAQAPQSLNEALQAARSGDPNVQAPAFAQMPWGTTFAQPQLSTVDPSTVAFNNFLTQNTDRAPTQTLDDMRQQVANELNQSRTFFDPTLFGPPQTFQTPPSREAPPNVPLPTANPLNPFERGQVNERPAAPERGINPQDRDAVSRAVERTVTERAPVVEREQSRAPLQVTVPGRTAPAQTQSRSSDTRGANASRGQLDGLLNQARTAPTLAGRIAALDALNGIISAMKAAGLPNPYGRDPDPGINAALRMGR